MEAYIRGLLSEKYGDLPALKMTIPATLNDHFISTG
jgi:hypothetical protein